MYTQVANPSSPETMACCATRCPISQGIESLIMAQTSSHDLYRKAREEGMIPLRQAGIKKVLLGLTSLDEVLRVTMDSKE